MKRIFKEPIFSAVERNSPICDSTSSFSIGVRYRASELPCTSHVKGSLTVVEKNYCVLCFMRLFICYTGKKNLFANMGLD